MPRLPLLCLVLLAALPLLARSEAERIRRDAALVSRPEGVKARWWKAWNKQRCNLESSQLRFA